MSEQKFTDAVLTINTEKQSTNVERKNILSLVRELDPILSETIPEFDFTNPEYNAVEIASDLVETCKHYKGLGLSANQCGLRHRVFVAGFGENFVAFFNPKVISVGKENVHMSEGCLSYPHLFISITRPDSVHLEYEDFNGEKKQGIYTGLTARIILHELDHLNGVTFTKKAKPLALKCAVEKRQKLYKSFEKSTNKMSKVSKKLRK